MEAKRSQRNEGICKRQRDLGGTDGFAREIEKGQRGFGGLGGKEISEG